MYEYIKGDIAELNPTQVVIDVHGIGYILNISLHTFTNLQGSSNAKLFVHEQLVTGGRDDAFNLFGFATSIERELFRLLLTVSGVGANSARMILSTISPTELIDVIATGNDKMLKAVKGIGAKTAQRIIVDLRDKMTDKHILPSVEASDSTAVAINHEVKDEAVSALTMLGFSPAPTAKAVIEILKAQPDLPVEQVVKLALKQIK